MNQEPRNLDIKGEILPEGVENQVEVDDNTMDFEPGDIVNVKRSDGTVESDWTLVFMNIEEGIVKVAKETTDGRGLFKNIPLDEFMALNARR